MNTEQEHSQRAWPYFCGTGVGAKEVRPVKKLCYFVFFSRVRDVKFLLVNIQFDRQLNVFNLLLYIVWINVLSQRVLINGTQGCMKG